MEAVDPRGTVLECSLSLSVGCGVEYQLEVPSSWVLALPSSLGQGGQRSHLALRSKHDLCVFSVICTKDSGLI